MIMLILTSQEREEREGIKKGILFCFFRQPVRQGSVTFWQPDWKTQWPQDVRLFCKPCYHSKFPCNYKVISMSNCKINFFFYGEMKREIKSTLSTERFPEGSSSPIKRKYKIKYNVIRAPPNMLQHLSRIPRMACLCCRCGRATLKWTSVFPINRGLQAVYTLSSAVLSTRGGGGQIS